MSSRSTSSLFLRLSNSVPNARIPGRRISCRAAVSLRFQFWNGHEIPRVFYLFPGLPGLKGTRPLAASRVLHSRTKNRIFNRFSLLHLEAPGRVSSSLLSSSLSLSLSLFPLSLCPSSKFPRYPSFMSRTLKRNMNGLRAPVRHTLGGK